MSSYSKSAINPFWVSTKVSNNGVTIQHYPLLQTERIHIEAYFPLEILKAGNTLVLPLFGFLPRFYGLLMPFIGLGFCEEWREHEWVCLHSGMYSAQQSQTKSLASCIAKGRYSNHYAMVSGFHNASSDREAYGQCSYTADQKLLQPG